MKHRPNRFTARAVVGLVVLFASSTTVHAVDVLFKNAPGTTSLTNNLNWDGAALPGVGDVATWGAAAGGNSQGGALSWASGKKRKKKQKQKRKGRTSKSTS